MKTILGNREHKKTNFRFLGNRGTSQFISGEQGNRYPPPWEGLLIHQIKHKDIKRSLILITLLIMKKTTLAHELFCDIYNHIFNRFLPAILYFPSKTPFYASVSKGAASLPVPFSTPLL